MASCDWSPGRQLHRPGVGAGVDQAAEDGQLLTVEGRAGNNPLRSWLGYKDLYFAPRGSYYGPSLGTLKVREGWLTALVATHLPEHVLWADVDRLAGGRAAEDHDGGAALGPGQRLLQRGREPGALDDDVKPALLQYTPLPVS